MSVNTDQPDRMVRDRLAEQVVSGEGLVGPILLVPSSALNPLTDRRGLGTLAHKLHNFLVGLGTAQVHHLCHHPKVPHVAVGIGESWDNRAAAHVHSCRIAGSGFQDDLVVSDGGNAVAVDGDSCCVRP